MKILKSYLATCHGLLTVAAAGMLLLALASQAFPPAPSHLIYGQVRDEYGVPLSVTNALIVFESTNAEQVTSSIVPNLQRIAVEDIEAIEFFAGPAQTPAEYSDLGSNCGVLVLHTRRFESPKPTPPKKPPS